MKERKHKFFLKKWYFWLAVIIDLLLFEPAEATGFIGWSGSFVGAFIVVFFVFFIFWWIIKVFRMVKEKRERG